MEAWNGKEGSMVCNTKVYELRKGSKPLRGCGRCKLMNENWKIFSFVNIISNL